ncbi:Mesocentin [Toxocara canis]|uniref:Mesocentin n=1 Tax=Toxocara canis TaxID=6265 RepID=A0A0B2UX26_TOXCA|nr:Mesocentin [Toxocara canis]
MSESEEAVSDRVEVVKEGVNLACCIANGNNSEFDTLQPETKVEGEESELVGGGSESVSKTNQRLAQDTDNEDLAKANESLHASHDHHDPNFVTEDAAITAVVSISARTNESDEDDASHLEAESEGKEKQASDSSKGAGWVFQGEHSGYAYYTGSAGQVYSVDRNGYWYIQQGSGDFVPFDSSVEYESAQTKMFPLNEGGQPTLPLNAQGEKVFPRDANHIPIFPMDPETGLPIFPVDDSGQPVFPTGVNGRPIVPVDNNGAAIFPRDKNGKFIFPSGSDGKPVAPVNTYGIPVLPMDENGKLVIPYDSNGSPIIHLASDGVTPLTQEEYQYTLQWSDYYDKCNQYYSQQHISQQVSSSLTATTSAEALEQHEKNLKLLKKVRPEDIDLPPTEPPPPMGPIPVSMTPASATLQPEPPKEDEKSKAEMQLKAKTKRLLEMQLRFTRKAALGCAKATYPTKTKYSASESSDGNIVSARKSVVGSQETETISSNDESGNGKEVTHTAGKSTNVEVIETINSSKSLPSARDVPETGSSVEKVLGKGPIERGSADTLILPESSKENEDPERGVEDLDAKQRNADAAEERNTPKSNPEKDSFHKTSRIDTSTEGISLNDDSLQKLDCNDGTEVLKPHTVQNASPQAAKSSISKSESLIDSSNKENSERRYSRSSSGDRRRSGRSSSRRKSSSSHRGHSIDHDRLDSERSYRSYRHRDSRSRSDSYSPCYRSHSSRRHASSSRRSRSSPRYSSRSRERSFRGRYSRRERSSSRTRRYIRERSAQKRGRSYRSESYKSYNSSGISRCWSSSRERSPYRGRSSDRSHWERSSSRRRSRSRDYSTSRRSTVCDHSISREHWSSRRRSRSASSGRSSRGRSASHSPCRADSSASAHGSSDTRGDARLRNPKSKSYQKSSTAAASNLTSIRSDDTSKLKSSIKTVDSLSEMRRKENSAKVQMEMRSEGDASEAVRAIRVGSVGNAADTSEKERRGPDSSSSRERSPYRGRSSDRSHWERSSSRRRSRSRDYSTSRRSTVCDHSISREHWSSRRRSRSASSGRSSRGRSASHSPCRADSSASAHGSSDTRGDARLRNPKSKSYQKSSTAAASNLTSIRSDDTSKLKSSIKTIDSLSEICRSLMEKSENVGQIEKVKKQKDKKRKKKKKKNRKHSSTRRRKENSAKVQMEMRSEGDASEAVRAIRVGSVGNAADTSEKERRGPDSYGPQPPEEIPKEDESEISEITNIAKETNSRKDKGDNKKKRKRRKKKIKNSGSEREKDMRDEKEDVNELDGIEPGEILEQDPSPKSSPHTVPTAYRSFVDESDGLSVVFIGPKWDANAKNGETTKVGNDSSGVTSPKIYCSKFICETTSSPIITFTSNPTMAESFVKLKKEFDSTDGPRRSVQASRHFQAAMEILNAPSEERSDVVGGSIESAQQENPASQIYCSKFICETTSSPIITFTSNPTMAESFVKLKKEFDSTDGPRRSVQASRHFQAAMEILNAPSEERSDVVGGSIESAQQENPASQMVESENSETAVVSKWKPLEEKVKGRRERKKAKKERKLKSALEKERRQTVEHDEAVALTEERDDNGNAQPEGMESGLKATGFEEAEEMVGSVHLVMAKETEVATQKGATVIPMSNAAVVDATKPEISVAKNADMVVDEAVVMDISEVPLPTPTESKSNVETSVNLSPCITQLSNEGDSARESVSAVSGRDAVIHRQFEDHTETCINEVTSACTSGKDEKATQADDETRRRKEIVKRKLEEDEEDELSRLRYEALRSKTRRLMNDLRTERRRLKRERLRATLAMRRARGYDDDICVDNLLLADSSETSDSDDSDASSRACRKNVKQNIATMKDGAADDLG